jgi:hypothetical protein
MNSNKIQSSLYVAPKFGAVQNRKGYNSRTQNNGNYGSNYSSNVAFTGGANLSNKGWFFLRNLSEKMKEASEITNALIAAIGTGIIAPLIIMVSPGKGDKEDNDKKFFQAIRQPLSAGLALSFQVPMTLAINKYINKLAYEKKIPLFNDDVIGSLIPDKKFLKKQITPQEIQEWESKFEEVRPNGTTLKQELEEQIRNKYSEVGLEVKDDKLAKEVAKEKQKFLKDKIVDEKRKQLLDAKYEELKGKNFNIKDKDLVTEEYRNLAIERDKEGFAAIEKGKKLSLWDRTTRLMGFSTKKVKELEEAQKEWATNQGLEILKKEEPELFAADDFKARIKKYIETQDVKAQKLFGNKKFWLSLLVNLFMVTASCYALNWSHPRLKELIDKFDKNNTTEQPAPEVQKAEVK